MHTNIDTIAFTTALQNEMTTGGGDSNKSESEQQIDIGGDQMETGSGDKETQDKHQADDDEEDDDTMNVE